MVVWKEALTQKASSKFAQASVSTLTSCHRCARVGGAERTRSLAALTAAGVSHGNARGGQGTARCISHAGPDSRRKSRCRRSHSVRHVQRKAARRHRFCRALRTSLPNERGCAAEQAPGRRKTLLSCTHIGQSKLSRVNSFSGVGTQISKKKKV